MSSSKTPGISFKDGGPQAHFASIFESIKTSAAMLDLRKVLR